MLVRILDLIGNQHACSNVVVQSYVAVLKIVKGTKLSGVLDADPASRISTARQDFIHNFHITFLARWYRKRKVKVFDCFYT